MAPRPPSAPAGADRGRYMIYPRRKARTRNVSDQKPTRRAQHRYDSMIAHLSDCLLHLLALPGALLGLRSDHWPELRLLAPGKGSVCRI
eukprot:scaffold3567_cov146-Isochrysis_galbana.AAC.1